MISGGGALLMGTDGKLTNILSSELCAYASGVQQLVVFMTENSRICQAVFGSMGNLFNLKSC